MNTSVTETERPTRRLRLPSFGVQVLIGLALGVVLGLVARSMGPDSVDAAGVADDVLVPAASDPATTRSPR